MVIRKGIKNGSQLWLCKDCNKYFCGRRWPSDDNVARAYSSGRSTVSDLAVRFNVSASTIKRRLKTMRAEEISTQAHDAVVLMDTTYWGRNFGVTILMNASDSRVLWFKFIDRKERLDDYREGLAYLRKSGMLVKAVVGDGFTGLKEMLSGIPYQLCQFHQLQRIRQLLTNNPKLPASVELKETASTLTTSDREQFRAMLESWHDRWRDFLKEKTVVDSGKSFFTHRRTRSAYYSLKTHLDVLFTYQDFTDGSVPNTNNALESLNSVIKTKLRNHRGISIKRRMILLANLLRLYKPDKQRHCT